MIFFFFVCLSRYLAVLADLYFQLGFIPYNIALPIVSLSTSLLLTLALCLYILYIITVSSVPYVMFLSIPSASLEKS